MKNIKEMTLEEKIGQLFWVGFHGYQLSDNLRHLIDKYKIGNVILFARNVKDIHQLFILNQDIHNYVMGVTGIMPLISIDQEGGMVTRITEGATFPPGNMTIGTAKVKDSYEIGRVVGEELRALGINVNLAPSLDVNNNPYNPVIGVRSYSDNPEVVAKYGLNYIRGLQENGVIATAKHFPGHGDTVSDSHKSLPIINHNKERLDSVELLPFKKVLNEVEAIMSAHCFFDAYEKDNIPATLSKNVITGLLRKELGYKGLIISDCMEMKAIDDTFTTPVGCVMGLMAGLDQVMISATYEKQVASIEAVYKAYSEGKLTIEEIDKKVERILKVKEKSYKLMSKYFYNQDYFDARNIIDNEEHKKLANRITDNSLTLYQGSNIDYKYLYNKETLVIATEPFVTTIAEDVFSPRSITSAIISNGIDVVVEKINVYLKDEEINSLIDKAKKYKQVIIFTYNALFVESQVRLINRINVINNNLYVVSMRNPYDIKKFRNVKNYLCLYEYTPNSVSTVVKWLKHEIVPFGVCPVKLTEDIVTGASVYVGLDDYPLIENIKYLHLLKDNGITNIFMSGHMPERNSKFNDELNAIITEANELGIKVTLDVSKEAYLNLDVNNLYGLRLDWGFTEEDILNIYKEGKYHIELNGSTINRRLLDYLQFNGVDFNNISISHNFYPKKYTGLDEELVIKKNRLFHEYGLKVYIFIPSNNMHRPPLYEGLPTLEVHRDLNIYSVLSTVKYLEADGVFFGDSFASAEELKFLVNYNFDIITIPIVVSSNLLVSEKEALNGIHDVRIDSPIYFTRSGRKVTDILPHDTIDRLKFDVTIDNIKFGRYQGEVNIMRENLPSDERVNVIGKAVINDLVLKALQNGKRFKFVIIGEYD